MRSSVLVRAAVPVAALAVLAAACGGDVTGGSFAPTITPTATATPGSLGATLQPVVTQAMAQMQVPGAIVYVDVPGLGTWQAALGVGNLATGTPMIVPDHMRIGSITKTFTATVVLQLSEEGKLSLDDLATKYVPGAPANGATVRQVLQMTSGVFNYTDDPGYAAASAADPTRVWTPEEFLAIAAKHKPYFPAGKGIHYSNTNYTLAGMIAEKAGGEPIGDLITKRIITPLALGGCSYPAVAPAIPDPHPQGYQFGGVAVADSPAAVPTSAPPEDVTAISPSMAGAAGAMICTVDDLRIWSKALATGQLLTPALQQQRVKVIPLTKGSPGGYGLGIVMTAGGFLGHNGEIPGFQSIALYNPSAGATVIVLANLSASADGKPPADQIAAAIIKTVAGSPSVGPSAIPSVTPTSTG